MARESDEKTPAELVATFSRCKKFPGSELELNALIQGLVRAANHCDVAAADIVLRCAAVSEYCPTDADLLTIAKELRDERIRRAEAGRNQAAEWRRTYGPPRPFDMSLLIRLRSTPRRDDLLWAALKRQLGPVALRKMSWLQLADVAEELGYPDYAQAWRDSSRGCGAA